MEPQHIISIDEDHSRNVVSKEDGLAITREERFRRLMDVGGQTREAKAAKIQKVRFLLRGHRCFVNFFEPRVASFGPIHHSNPKNRLGEKFKLILAYEFVQDSRKSIDILYNQEVETKIKQMRECFEEEVTNKYDDEAFAGILFVDGCAILEYIFCATNPDKFNKLNIKNDNATFAHQDLFLLENQVPYRLLNLLMGLSGKEDDLRKSIQSFIRNVSYLQTGPQQKQTEREVPTEGREPTHLLDLLRTTLLGPQRSPKRTPLRRCLCPWGKTHGEDLDWQSYRNVQELKASGIRLKRSKSNYLRDISFSRRFGFYPVYLSLPPITLDDSTGPTFMNLVAYEMCVDFENDFGISSYISFLDSLIRDDNDVKYMRKARVLHNFLGTDQHVADLFNEISTDLVPSTDAYKDVKLQIQEYYDNNRIMTWMAQFYDDHFSTPWSITSFVFSIVLALILTAIQTWYTVFPPPGP